MNLPGFIAKRIQKNTAGSFSSTVSRIAVISVAISILAMIIAYSVLEGFKVTIHDKLISFTGHIVVTQYDQENAFDDTPIQKERNTAHLDEKYNEIEHVQVFARKTALLKSDTEILGVLVKGMGDDFKTETLKTLLEEGEIPDFGDTSNFNKVCISSHMASLLNVSVGEEILASFIDNPPRFRKVEVMGIYNAGMEEVDEFLVLAPISLIRDVNDWSENYVGGFEIILKDLETLPVMKEIVFDEMDYNLQLELVTNRYYQIFEWFNVLDRNVLIFYVIILAVSLFNIASSIFILIVERTQMIGVLKGLGAGNGLIKKIFLFVGLRICLLGLLIGNSIALLFCWLQASFNLIPLDPKSYYMDTVPVSLSVAPVVALNVLVIVVVTLVLYVPALIVSKINPSKSIRFN